MDWSDDRLQERFDSIDRRFDEVDRRFDEVDRRFGEVDKRFDKVEGELKDGLKALDAKFDGLQRTLMLTGGGIVATLITGIVAVVATQL